MRLRMGGYAQVLVEATTDDGIALKGKIGKIVAIKEMTVMATNVRYKTYALDFGENIGRVGFFPMYTEPTLEAVSKPKLSGGKGKEQSARN